MALSEKNYSEEIKMVESKNDTDGRLRVLEAIMPRIEKQAEETSKILFAKLDYIKDNMVTKSELEPVQKDADNANDAGDTNKKKLQNIQFQIYGLGVLFLISLTIGAAKTLSLMVSIVPKVIAP